MEWYRIRLQVGRTRNAATRSPDEQKTHNSDRSRHRRCEQLLKPETYPDF